ncbi:hypothetical protein [Glutamicibacter sp.]|uniref:hypothetical protein n=1 Tax=Glutamicibacter sp. TaxID=1931995 RepID=UPI003FA52557
MKEACRRLVETDETAASLAKSVGYETAVAFRQRFQALKSLPPVEYLAAFRK